MALRFLFISDKQGDIDLANGLAAKIEKIVDGHQVISCNAEDMKMKDCQGCFSCWIKTPGICINNDSGAKLCRDYITCDQVILLTPVRFGCYSPAIKRVFERISPINQPFIRQCHGRSRHAPRYKHYPDIAVVGYGNDITLEEEKTFVALSNRNAVNFQKNNSKATVCRSIEEADEALISLGLVFKTTKGEAI